MRIVRDLGIAEELAHDALVIALEQWPESGVPRNPGAWLMTTAKYRAVDYCRRTALIGRKHEILSRELTQRESEVPDLAAAMDENIGDDLLRLLFAACHPVFRLKPEWPLRCACWEVLAPTKLRAHIWLLNRPSRSGSFERRGH
jgi:predicted RNA polymerase sigma factor